MAHAIDYGTFGETFCIQEKDLITLLQERLKESKIDMLALQNQFTETAKNPQGRALPKATSIRHFEYDPTLYVQEDIKDHKGKILISKGTKVNPLDKTPLLEDLLFFDGTDLNQIAWAKTLQGIWILTCGSPLEIEKIEERPVYFDQAGYLTSKLGIQALPAKVSQSGKHLRIEEIPCF